jgi:hypothetical protein
MLMRIWTQSKRPQVFPALFDWVSYPIATLIKALYKYTKGDGPDGSARPCPMHLELIASCERALCYCHTGNAAVLATSLMHPLGLSRGILEDGSPMLLRTIFERPTIHNASLNGFKVIIAQWPIKDNYPAMASKRAQVLTYSATHFHVSNPNHTQ